MGFDLGGLLQQYVNGTDRSTHSTEDHFQQASDNAPASLVSRGLAAAFRSDATPAFGQMAGELFGRSNPNQQAGMLNQLIAGMGVLQEVRHILQDIVVAKRQIFPQNRHFLVALRKIDHDLRLQPRMDVLRQIERRGIDTKPDRQIG